MSKVGASGNNSAQSSGGGSPRILLSSSVVKKPATSPELVAIDDNPLTQTPQKTCISERFREIMENSLKKHDQIFRNDMKEKALSRFSEKYFDNPIAIEQEIKEANNKSALRTDCLQPYEDSLPADYRFDLKEIKNYINASEQAKSNIDLFKQCLEEELKDSPQEPEEVLRNNIKLCEDGIKYTFSIVTKGNQIRMSEETSNAAKERYSEIEKRINIFLLHKRQYELKKRMDELPPNHRNNVDS